MNNHVADFALILLNIKKDQRYDLGIFICYVNNKNSCVEEKHIFQIRDDEFIAK